MQFQVPQFIETEDKIVGPFTLRQFAYVGGAGIISFIFYFTVEFWVWILFSIILVPLAAALAFIKIEGRPLVHILLSAFNFYWKPQTYVWHTERPEAKKDEAEMRRAETGGIPLEDIISGAALRSIWNKLQTGAKISGRQFLQGKTEHYQIFQKLSGERRAARRVDYR